MYMWLANNMLSNRYMDCMKQAIDSMRTECNVHDNLNVQQIIVLIEKPKIQSNLFYKNMFASNDLFVLNRISVLWLIT